MSDTFCKSTDVDSSTFCPTTTRVHCLPTVHDNSSLPNLASPKYAVWKSWMDSAPALPLPSVDIPNLASSGFERCTSLTMPSSSKLESSSSLFSNHSETYPSVLSFEKSYNDVSNGSCLPFPQREMSGLSNLVQSVSSYGCSDVEKMIVCDQQLMSSWHTKYLNARSELFGDRIHAAQSKRVQSSKTLNKWYGVKKSVRGVGSSNGVTENHSLKPDGKRFYEAHGYHRDIANGRSRSHKNVVPADVHHHNKHQDGLDSFSDTSHFLAVDVLPEKCTSSDEWPLWSNSSAPHNFTKDQPSQFPNSVSYNGCSIPKQSSDNRNLHNSSGRPDNPFVPRLSAERHASSIIAHVPACLGRIDNSTIRFDKNIEQKTSLIFSPGRMVCDENATANCDSRVAGITFDFQAGKISSRGRLNSGEIVSSSSDDVRFIAFTDPFLGKMPEACAEQPPGFSCSVQGNDDVKSSHSTHKTLACDDECAAPDSILNTQSSLEIEPGVHTLNNVVEKRNVASLTQSSMQLSTGVPLEESQCGGVTVTRASSLQEQDGFNATSPSCSIRGARQQATIKTATLEVDANPRMEEILDVNPKSDDNFGKEEAASVFVQDLLASPSSESSSDAVAVTQDDVFYSHEAVDGESILVESDEELRSEIVVAEIKRSDGAVTEGSEVDVAQEVALTPKVDAAITQLPGVDIKNDLSSSMSQDSSVNESCEAVAEARGDSHIAAHISSDVASRLESEALPTLESKLAVKLGSSAPLIDTARGQCTYELGAAVSDLLVGQGPDAPVAVEADIVREQKSDSPVLPESDAVITKLRRETNSRCVPSTWGNSSDVIEIDDVDHSGGEEESDCVIIFDDPTPVCSQRSISRGSNAQVIVVHSNPSRCHIPRVNSQLNGYDSDKPMMPSAPRSRDRAVSSSEVGFGRDHLRTEEMLVDGQNVLRNRYISSKYPVCMPRPSSSKVHAEIARSCGAFQNGNLARTISDRFQASYREKEVSDFRTSTHSMAIERKMARKLANQMVRNREQVEAQYTANALIGQTHSQAAVDCRRAQQQMAAIQAERMSPMLLTNGANSAVSPLHSRLRNLPDVQVLDEVVLKTASKDNMALRRSLDSCLESPRHRLMGDSSVENRIDGSRGERWAQSRCNANMGAESSIYSSFAPPSLVADTNHRGITYSHEARGSTVSKNDMMYDIPQSRYERRKTTDGHRAPVSDKPMMSALNRRAMSAEMLISSETAWTDIAGVRYQKNYPLQYSVDKNTGPCDTSVPLSNLCRRRAVGLTNPSVGFSMWPRGCPDRSSGRFPSSADEYTKSSYEQIADSSRSNMMTCAGPSQISVLSRPEVPQFNRSSSLPQQINLLPTPGMATRVVQCAGNSTTVAARGQLMKQLRLSEFLTSMRSRPPVIDLTADDSDGDDSDTMSCEKVFSRMRRKSSNGHRLGMRRPLLRRPSVVDGSCCRIQRPFPSRRLRKVDRSLKFYRSFVINLLKQYRFGSNGMPSRILPEYPAWITPTKSNGQSPINSETSLADKTNKRSASIEASPAHCGSQESSCSGASNPQSVRLKINLKKAISSKAVCATPLGIGSVSFGNETPPCSQGVGEVVYSPPSSNDTSGFSCGGPDTPPCSMSGPCSSVTASCSRCENHTPSCTRSTGCRLLLCKKAEADLGIEDRDQTAGGCVRKLRSQNREWTRMKMIESGMCASITKRKFEELTLGKPQKSSVCRKLFKPLSALCLCAPPEPVYCRPVRIILEKLMEDDIQRLKYNMNVVSASAENCSVDELSGEAESSSLMTDTHCPSKQCDGKIESRSRGTSRRFKAYSSDRIMSKRTSTIQTIILKIDSTSAEVSQLRSTGDYSTLGCTTDIVSNSVNKGSEAVVGQANDVPLGGSNVQEAAEVGTEIEAEIDNERRTHNETEIAAKPDTNCVIDQEMTDENGYEIDAVDNKQDRIQSEMILMKPEPYDYSPPNNCVSGAKLEDTNQHDEANPIDTKGCDSPFSTSSSATVEYESDHDTRADFLSTDNADATVAKPVIKDNKTSDANLGDVCASVLGVQVTGVLDVQNAKNVAEAVDRSGSASPVPDKCHLKPPPSSSLRGSTVTTRAKSKKNLLPEPHPAGAESKVIIDPEAPCRIVIVRKKPVPKTCEFLVPKPFSVDDSAKPCVSVVKKVVPSKKVKHTTSRLSISDTAPVSVPSKKVKHTTSRLGISDTAPVSVPSKKVKHTTSRLGISDTAPASGTKRHIQTNLSSWLCGVSSKMSQSQNQSIPVSDVESPKFETALMKMLTKKNDTKSTCEGSSNTKVNSVPADSMSINDTDKRAIEAKYEADTVCSTSGMLPIDINSDEEKGATLVDGCSNEVYDGHSMKNFPTSPQIDVQVSMSEFSLFDVEECLQDTTWCSTTCVDSACRRDNSPAPKSCQPVDEKILQNSHTDNTQARHSSWPDSNNLLSSCHHSNTAAPMVTETESIASGSHLEHADSRLPLNASESASFLGHRGSAHIPLPPSMVDDRTIASGYCINENPSGQNSYCTDSQSNASSYRFNGKQPALLSHAAVGSFGYGTEEGSHLMHRYRSEAYATGSSRAAMSMSDTPFASVFSNDGRADAEYQQSCRETAASLGSRYSISDERDYLPARSGRLKSIHPDNVSWPKTQNRSNAPSLPETSGRGDYAPAIMSPTWLSRNCHSQPVVQNQASHPSYVSPVAISNECNFMPYPEVPSCFRTPSKIDCHQPHLYASQDIHYPTQVWSGTAVAGCPRVSSQSRQFHNWYSDVPPSNVVPSWPSNSHFNQSTYFESGTSAQQYRGQRRDDVVMSSSSASVQAPLYVDSRFDAEIARDNDGELSSWIAASLALQ